MLVQYLQTLIMIKENSWAVNVAEGQINGFYQNIHVRIQQHLEGFDIYLNSALRGSISKRSPMKAINAAKDMIDAGLR